MKRLAIAIVVSLSLVAAAVYAGEIVTLPKAIIIQDPTTDQIDKHSVEFFYGPPAYAVIRYRPIDTSGRMSTRYVSIKVQNEVDNPDTAAANCVGVEDPWPGCTGVGTGGTYLDPATEAPWDETSTDFTSFVSGFGATLKTRSDAVIYSDVQSRFDLEE
jgi:hypothetical protein